MKRLTGEEPSPKHRADPVEPSGEPGSCTVEIRSGAPGNRDAKGGELGLELGRQAGILAAELALDLLEGHIGVEGDVVSAPGSPVRAKA